MGLSIAAAEETESGALLRLVSPLAGLSLMASVSAVSAARSKRHLLSTIDPAMADLITPAMMKKIHELQTLEKFLASVPVDGSGSDYQQQSWPCTCPVRATCRIPTSVWTESSANTVTQTRTYPHKNATSSPSFCTTSWPTSS